MRTSKHLNRIGQKKRIVTEGQERERERPLYQPLLPKHTEASCMTDSVSTLINRSKGNTRSLPARELTWAPQWEYLPVLDRFRIAK